MYEVLSLIYPYIVDLMLFRYYYSLLTSYKRFDLIDHTFSASFLALLHRTKSIMLLSLYLFVKFAGLETGCLGPLFINNFPPGKAPHLPPLLHTLSAHRNTCSTRDAPFLVTGKPYRQVTGFPFFAKCDVRIALSDIDV